MSGLENLVGKWENEYNNKVSQLENIREFVSGEYIRRAEIFLDEKRKMIEELKDTIYEASSN